MNRLADLWLCWIIEFIVVTYLFPLCISLIYLLDVILCFWSVYRALVNMTIIPYYIADLAYDKDPIYLLPIAELIVKPSSNFDRTAYIIES